MGELPSGTVTFLFTDIEGSTRLWEAHGDAMRDALARHDEILRKTIEKHSGALVKQTGDGVYAVFAAAKDAVGAALAAQQTLRAQSWGEAESLPVRMGLHTGDASERGGDYYGPEVNRAARVMSVGHGDQILLSGTTGAMVSSDMPDGASLKDLGNHRLRDLSQPLQIFQLVHERLPDEFEPLRSLDGFPNNLPIAVSNFVGRESEVAELSELLGTTRLLTLTGAGGTGKTRLALQVAAESLGDFADGVWFVELAGLTIPGLVPRQVASALGIPEKAGREWTDVIRGFIGERELLLVLDNCEHLIDAAASLTMDLLEGGSGLRVLATSRETLNLPGEITWQVPLLSSPVNGEETRIDELMRYESVQLFVDRAQAASPNIGIADDDAPALADICRRLDGLPLALELAAARVRALSVPQIAQHLDDRFALLTGGSRAALPRQQTLEAAVAWSYELLSEEERRILARLSVFAGGFDLEAGNQVAGGGVLDGIPSLVDKSLLVAEPHGKETRYRMLETIAAFGLERLGGEAPDAKNAHLAWAAELAGVAAQKFEGPEQAEWLSKVATELHNFRAAMQWAIDSGDPAPGFVIASSLYRYWYIRGAREGGRWLDRFLDLTQKVPDEVMAGALRAAGASDQVLGEYERAATRLQRSLELYQGLGNRRGANTALYFLARAQWGRIDPQRIREMLDTVAAEFREMDDAAGLGFTLIFVVFWEMDYGKPDRALAVAEELETVCEAVGAPQLLAHAMELPALALMMLGELEDAGSRFRRALDLYRQIGNQQCTAHCLENTAAWVLAGGDAENSAVLLGATEALRADIGVPIPPYESILFEDTLKKVVAALGKAPFDAAWQRGQAMDMEEALNTAISVTGG